jgi:hypothetical protein
MLETTVSNITARIEKYNNDYVDGIHSQPNVYLQRFLINRSATHAGLLGENFPAIFFQNFPPFSFKFPAIF